MQLIDMTFLSVAGDAVTPHLTLRGWVMVEDRAFELCYLWYGQVWDRDEWMGVAPKSLV